MAYLGDADQLPSRAAGSAGARRAERGDRARRRARRRRAAGPRRGRARARWAQPGAGQPPAPRTGPRPAGRRAGHGVLSRRPHAGQGRPGRPAAVPRRHAGEPGREVRRRPPRARPHRAPAQHAATPVRRSTRRDDNVHARRVGCQAGRGGGAVRPGPGDAGTRIEPHVVAAYSGSPGPTMSGSCTTRPGERRARRGVCAARELDVRRGVSTVGPHATSWCCRSAAAGPHPRLAGGAAHAGAGAAPRRPPAGWPSAPVAPVLVLDDVLSELDGRRAAALLAPPPGRPGGDHDGGHVPTAAAPERTLRITAGAVADEDGSRSTRGCRERRDPVCDPRFVGRSWCSACAGVRDGARSGACSGAGRRPSGRPWRPTSDPSAWSDGTLLVAVDDPAWATQVRLLADDLRAAARRRRVAVEQLEVRVGGPASRPAADRHRTLTRSSRTAPGIPPIVTRPW